MLSELVNSPEDTEEDQRLKFNLLVLYNQRIKEREKRRNFLIERNKLDLESEIKRLAGMSWEQRTAVRDLKKFERFLS